MAGVNRLLGQALVDGLCDSKVDYFGYGRAVQLRNQNIRWLDVAVDYSFLMRMLNCLTAINEQLQPLPAPPRARERGRGSPAFRRIRRFVAALESEPPLFRRGGGADGGRGA